MYTTKIVLDSIQNIKDFVNTVNKYDCKVDLVTSRYSVDAKSLMGIFSLEMGKPIDMKIHSKNCKRLLEDVQRFVINEENSLS